MRGVMIVQKLKRGVKDPYELGERYYAIISMINDLDLTKREVQLIAFTAIHGNISYNSVREDFCKRYNTSSPTINNMISKLKKLGILIKVNGKVKVNPKLILDFNRDITLGIKFEHETDSTNVKE